MTRQSDAAQSRRLTERQPAAAWSRRFTASLLVGVALFSVVVLTGAGKGDRAAFDRLHGEAEKARQKADSIGGEWRDTAKFLKQAKAAADAGKLGDAMKLARKAKEEGELGYRQASSQKGNVQVPSYLK
ncbi:MAG: SoxXA-binding protein [Gammaproteobacteria bacterium]|nr:SoxXA-binding protein [Gammaproteobacteria bacterium]